MSRFFRLSLCLIGLTIFVSSVSVTEAKAQNILGEILRRMDVNNKSLQSLKADVTMVKTDSTLGVSDTYTGVTSYLPKTNKRVMYARIDWIKPRQEYLTVIGDDFEMYSPKKNLVYYGKAQKAKDNSKTGGVLIFMSMSKEQLKANYAVVYIGEEQISGGAKTWHLQLTPKVATTYKTAEIWVDGDGMPRQAKINENNNDSTTVLLANIQKNVTLKGEIFKLKYPGSVVKQKV